VPSAIEIKGLTRVYRGSRKESEIRAVDGVDFDIAQGEVVALLGPNGAGKTTLVRMLSCLLRPTSGSARVGGHDLRESPEKVRANCGLSTEASGLYERLTARQYLTFFARLYGLADGDASTGAEKQLRAADLWDRRNDPLATFSKGMRQKINLARAVAHRPRVVFLDEPTSGLDVEAAGSIRQLILEMSQDGETTFLICTHNLPEAERLCGRIAIMRRGRVLVSGTPDELKRRLVGNHVLRVSLRKALPRHCQAVVSLPGVAEASLEGNQLVLQITADQDHTNPQIVRRLVESGADIIAFVGETRSLEDVYLHLVRREAEEDAMTS